MKKHSKHIEKAKAISVGDEPLVTKDSYRIDLIKALNWYNANWDEKNYRYAADAYIVKHMKMKEAASSLSRADFYEIRMIGSIGRLIMRDQFIDLDHVQRVFERVEMLKLKYAKQNIEVVEEKVSAPAVSIQERIAQTANNLASDVDGAIDEFVTKKTSFSMKSFLASNEVSGVVAKKIGEVYQPLMIELEEAIAGKDEQLKEGYEHLPKSKLKQFAEFIRQIITDCNQQVVFAKAQRKPRARKSKPASVIVKKMTYMKEYAELNLKSIPAEKIVGSDDLWCYNTVSRKLIWYKAADSNHLGVSGKSITNYDVDASEMKTLRDPAKFFKELASTGKRAMVNAWKAIKGKGSKPRSRINDDVILLGVN